MVRHCIEVAGSKSIMARVLMIAGFETKSIRIKNPAVCDDTQELLDAFETLGVRYQKYDNYLEIQPFKYPLESPDSLCFNGSATALRFMIARLAVINGLEVEITLSEKLAGRPHRELIDALPGTTVSEDGASIKIKGQHINRLELNSSGSISSQYVSAMMLAAPFTEHGFKMTIPESQVSMPYIEMTARVMRDFGANVTYADDLIHVPGRQKYRLPDIYEIEPDASTAAFWLVGGLIVERAVPIRYPSVDSLQGDARFLDVLSRMGARIERCDRCVKAIPERMHGIDVDMRDMPDCVPPLVMLALRMKNRTRISGIGHLRWKESNRIERLVSQVRRIGGKIAFENDTLIIDPLEKLLDTVIIETGSDHRIAMAFAILGLRCKNIEIDDLGCVSKSCDNFWKVLRQI